MNSLDIPHRPAELLGLEQRLAAIRGEARDVETELLQIQDAQWNAKQRKENLDLSAERVAAGETTAACGAPTPEHLEELKTRAEILFLADRKLSATVELERRKFGASVTSALRPAHRVLVARIDKALTALAEANAAEAEYLKRVPGCALKSMSFPNIGSGRADSPLGFWREHARRLHYLNDDDEAAR